MLRKKVKILKLKVNNTRMWSLMKREDWLSAFK